MKKVLLTSVLAVGFLSNAIADKIPITKERDRIRLGGYNHVVVKDVYAEDETTLIAKRIECSAPGEMKCKDQTLIFGGELDDFVEYTPAERDVAQSILSTGDDKIDAGQSVGVETITTLFLNTETSVSYYRTFSYVWSTNAAEEVISTLIISDPIFVPTIN